MTKALLVLLTAAMLPGCSGDAGGDSDGGFNTKGCPGNANVDATSALDLAAGQSTSGYLCPVRDQHWYRIQVPAGQPVVSVDLHNDTPQSAVTLYYTVRDGDGMSPIDQPPPPVKGTGQQKLMLSHCVPRPGTYYLQVQSYGDDATDARNPFTLSYTTGANPDPNEPQNSTPPGAVALTSGTALTGSIACKGDQDYYKITVPDSTLLNISLTTLVPTPALNLKYTLLDDQQRYLADDAVPTGAAATSLQVVRATPGAGTYYLLVADQMNAGSDLKNPYTLKVSAIPEPDANDRPVRNDVPQSATLLGSWACGGGMSLSPKTAYLASRADVDWYKVNLSGVSPACPANIDVTATWSGGGKGLHPQVFLVYPDPSTACAKDADCRTLSHTCGDDNGCEYLGNQCDKQSNHCTGGTVCLPEKVCGVLQFAKQQSDASSGAFVRTAQPLQQAGSYYVGVRDFAAQAWDTTSAYNLAVRLDPDDNGPDNKEPDNFYTPYTFSSDLNLMKSRAHPLVFDKAYTSHIGYERDQDYFVFDHPCKGADCTLSITYSTSGPSPVYFTYQVRPLDGPLVAGFPAAPATRKDVADKVNDTLFGDGTSTCFYASKRYQGPYYLWVSDLIAGGPKWDPGTAYTFTVHKVMDGCSPLCKQAPYNCGL